MHNKHIKYAAKITMTQEEYQWFKVFLCQACGIILGDSKQYLVENRLGKVFLEFNLQSFQELFQALKSNLAIFQHLKVCVIDAMTTNETFWFRDELQFAELQRKVLPELLESKTGTIKIWCAACSSGQEPYSISMCLEEVLSRQHGWVNKCVQIIATDISDDMLKQAKKAVYSNLESSRGLDDATKLRCFHQTQQGYQLKTEISQRVRFQQFDLLKSFSALGRFDIIFCRNVLIYFSDEVKRDILMRMANALGIGGYIFLSSTESMPTGLSEFETIRGGNTVYFRKVA